MSAHHAALLVAALLAGFIGGVAVVAVAGWFLRDKIAARLRR